MKSTPLSPSAIRATRGTDTQAEFALLIGATSFVLISRWERGHVRPCRQYQRAIRKLATKRGVDLAAE